MGDFGDKGNRDLTAFKDILRTKVCEGKSPIEGQQKAKPNYWISVTCGGAGWFAVVMWDGMGFPEPWDTGDGRHATQAEAIKEAKTWAAEENMEYRP